jgi:hypothetical protein
MHVPSLGISRLGDDPMRGVTTGIRLVMNP